MNENSKQLFQRGIKLQGLNTQYDQTNEECAELLVAINHFKRNRIPVEKLLEEIVDVRIMCNILEVAFKNMYGEDAIDTYLYQMNIEKEAKYKNRLDEIENNDIY